MKNWWRKARSRLAVVGAWRSPGEALLFLRAFCFAAAVPALVRLKWPLLENLLEPRQGTGAATALQVEQTLGCVNCVLSVGSPLVRDGCLTRGLTRYYFLRRAGLEVNLCFGIREVQGKFEGHCWLTKGGEPFLESKDPREEFDAIYTIPHASRPRPARREAEVSPRR